LSGNLERISKRLSYILRHHPDSVGLQLDPHGYVEVDLLLSALAAHGEAITLVQLQELVLKNDKKRFAFDEAGERIRANQGHSVEIDLNYAQRQPPPVLYHGTAARFIESIKAKGLIKGQRHHVHLTESIDTAMAVGSRYGKPLLLQIDSGAMHRDGAIFFLSDNHVWLTDFVSKDYIRIPD
jgi:putative RNA 2'-phosphotransferase